MKWDVRGAWKADGRAAQLLVDAPNQRAGELVANERGMVVESCWPVQDDAAVAAPTRRGGGGWRLLRNLALLVALLGGAALGVELAFNGGNNETVLIAGGAALALGVLGFLLFALLAWRARRG